MKTRRLKMVAKIFALVAIILCGYLLSNVSAAQDPAASALLFTYYDVRNVGTTDNWFAVTNTSASWVQAHVRLRTGAKSVELLDFEVLLSPKDIFTFDLYKSGDSVALSSCDTKTLTDSGFTVDASGCINLEASGYIGLIMKCEGVTTAEALQKTLQGYVEVIGEGEIEPASTNKNKCKSWEGLLSSDPDYSKKNIPGKTLYNITSSTNKCVSDDIVDMVSVLEGKVYYADIDYSALTLNNVAFLNAEAIDNYLPDWGDGRDIILHADTYTAEQARCATDGGCFAYVDAKASPAPTNGADDLNICFYTLTVSSGGGTAQVVNRFGAAASFGPTLADLYNRRDGSLSETANNLDNLSENLSMMWANDDMLAGDGDLIRKENADSHFWALPSGFDVASKFAFIFPFQHFINEADSITAVVYDTEENTIDIPTDKFISPGLPTPTTPGGEAEIFAFTPSFEEGWVSFSPIATNSTCDDIPTYADSDDDVRCGEEALDTYVPGYTGAVFTVGAHSLSAGHFHYRGAEVPY